MNRVGPISVNNSDRAGRGSFAEKKEPPPQKIRDLAQPVIQSNGTILQSLEELNGEVGRPLHKKKLQKTYFHTLDLLTQNPLPLMSQNQDPLDDEVITDVGRFFVQLVQCPFAEHHRCWYPVMDKFMDFIKPIYGTFPIGNENQLVSPLYFEMAQVLSLSLVTEDEIKRFLKYLCAKQIFGFIPEHGYAILSLFRTGTYSHVINTVSEEYFYQKSGVWRSWDILKGKRVLKLVPLENLRVIRV